MITTPILPPAPPTSATRILIFGLPCAGTTWLVNATAQLMHLRGDEPMWLGWHHELKNNQWPEMNAIVRVHAFDPVLATTAHHIFCCVQDLRDAVISTHRAVQRTPDRALADELMQCVEAWQSWATEVVVNEQLPENADHYLADLAHALEISDVAPQLIRLSQSLMEDFPGNTPGSDKTWPEIPPSERSAIETAHRPWLERHGYLKCQLNRSAPSAKSTPNDLPEWMQNFAGDYRALGKLKSLGFAPRTVLDVGASNGPWSVTCARHFPHAIYNLVEALPRLHGPMMHPIDGRQWLHFPVALGADVGHVDMNLPTDGFGVYEASAAMPVAAGRPFETLRVDMTTIDRLVGDQLMQIPDLVKLDVQGYELQVLRGGDCLWGKTEVFVVETSLADHTSERPLLFDIMQFFEAHGYRFFDYAGEFRTGAVGVLAEIDLVFIAKKGRVAQLISKSNSNSLPADSIEPVDSVDSAPMIEPVAPPIAVSDPTPKRLEFALASHIVASQGSKCRRVVDVGAHRGVFSNMVREAGAQVWLLEPNPMLFTGLEDRFRDCVDVKCLPFAASDKSGPGKLNLVESEDSEEMDLSLFSALDPHPMPGSLKFGPTIEIETRTIDDLISDGLLPSSFFLLKIDTEGAEASVLSGLTKANPDVVCLEYWGDNIGFRSEGSPPVSDMVEAMRVRGYPHFLTLFQTSEMSWQAWESGFSNVPGSWGNLFFFRDLDPFKRASDWCHNILDPLET